VLHPDNCPHDRAHHYLQADGWWLIACPDCGTWYDCCDAADRCERHAGM